MRCNTSVDLLSWATLLEAAVWLANGGLELRTDASVVREDDDVAVEDVAEDVVEDDVEDVYVPTTEERVAATVENLQDEFFSIRISAEDQVNALGGRSLLKDMYKGLGFEIARTNAKSKRGTAGEWIVITQVRPFTIADTYKATVGSVLTRINGLSVITMTYAKVNRALEEAMTQARADKKEVVLEFRRARSLVGTLFLSNKGTGASMKWKRQQVVLNGGVLSFADDEKKKANRVLDLGGCNVHIMKGEIDKRNFCIRIDEEDGECPDSVLIQCEEDGANGIVAWASVLIIACDVASGGRAMRYV
jgi:hypothetical protein